MSRKRLIRALQGSPPTRAKTSSEPLSWLERQRLKLKLGLNPLTNWVIEDQPTYLSSHAYPDKGIMHIAEDTPASVEAHEMGHLTHKDHPLESFLGGFKGLSTVGNVLPGLLAAGSDPGSAASRYAPVLGGALAAPTLLTELAASYRGAKALKEIRPDEPLLPLILAQLSYPLSTLPLSVGAPMYIRRHKMKDLKGGE